jgi:hypothetical protein
MPTVARPSLAVLVAALAVTLAPKALTTSYTAGDDFARLDQDIVRRLRAQGFAVTRRTEIDRPATFYGVRGSCRVMIRHATDPGSFDRKYRQNAKSIGPVQYRIGSDRFVEAPLLRLWVRDTIQLSKLRLGLAGPRPTAVAIATSKACPPGAVSTDDLMIHGKKPSR